jgi:hypothetical protein
MPLFKTLSRFMESGRFAIGVAAVVLGGLVLGSLLAGVADATVPATIAGTPLGPESENTHIVWTVIGAAAIVGAREVFA